MKIYKLIITLGLSILSVGVAQAACERLLELNIVNQTGEPVRVHSDQTCSCFSGWNGVIEDKGSTGWIKNDNDTGGSCGFHDTVVWYHMYATINGHEREIAEFDFVKEVMSGVRFGVVKVDPYYTAHENKSTSNWFSQDEVTLQKK